MKVTNQLNNETALWINYEVVNGEIANVMKVEERKPVEKYLRGWARFRHLSKKEIEEIQKIAGENARIFGL